MIIINDYMRLMDQKNRLLDIEVKLYDKNFNKIDSLEGVVIGGNITIDANNKIRRQCNIEMVVKEDKYGIGADKSIWLDKYMQIIIKLKDNKTEEYTPFNFGFFVINNPHIKFNATEYTVSFTGLDLMSKLSKEYGNCLKKKLIIDAKAPIKGVIESLVHVNGGIPMNRIIVDTDKLIPYELKKKEDDGVLDVLEEIRQLYLDYEMFFSEDGVFYYQPIQDKKNDPIWSEINDDLIISIEEKFNTDNVKNSVIVYGKLKDDKSQPMYTWTNNDPNNFFSIDKIGERNLTLTNDKYYTEEQCKSCAEYNGFIHGDLNETVNISCVPIYHMKVNKKIKLYNEKLEMNKTYLVQRINLSLDVQGEMAFEAIECRNSNI